MPHLQIVLAPTKPPSPQEPDDQELVVGRSLTLSCRVQAEKPVQYYWYKLSTLPSGDMTSDDNLYMAGAILLSVG